MLKHFVFLLVTYVLLVLETAPLERLVPAHAQPQFLWAGLALAAVLFQGPAALVWSAVVGLLVDCIAHQPVGVGMLSAAVAAFGMQSILPERARPSVLYAALAMFAGVLSALLLNEVVQLAAMRSEQRSMQSFMQMASSAGVTVIWSLPVHCTLLVVARLVQWARRSPQSFSQVSHRASVH